MSNYILSICIPTYNRCQYLTYLLDNIVEQFTADNLWNKVEVCISDNGSTDGTRKLVESYQMRFPIVYIASSTNLGADRNFLNCVAISTAKYCWLFGDDDRFEEGAIHRVLEQLAKYQGIAGISVNCQGYDINFEKKNNHYLKIDNDELLSDESDIVFKLGRYFGYLSGQVIDRKMWNMVLDKYDIATYYNAYVHVYIIFRVIQFTPKWLFISDRLVGWRSDNDSFLTKSRDGFYQRLRVDFGYLNIVGDVFGRGIYIKFSNLLCQENIFAGLQRMKFNNNITIAPLFSEIVRRFWFCPSFYYKVIPLYILPNFVIRWIHKLKSGLRKLNLIK